MTRLPMVVLPFLTFAGAALAATPPATTPAQPPHARHVMATHERSTSTPEALRETHALNLLEAKGYGDFTNFRADGKNFTATVAAQGKSATVIVNPDSGQITRQG
jgi:hypothetical protein